MTVILRREISSPRRGDIIYAAVVMVMVSDPPGVVRHQGRGVIPQPR